MNHRTFLTLTLLLGVPLLAAAATPASPKPTAPRRMDRYNVVWNSPSKDASGMMPIGNGDIGAGVYAIENGDLFLLLSKNDAYNYMGDLFKTGRVRIALDPNPFKARKPFRQTLDLATGSITIEADGVSLRIWADANHPVYHIEVRSPRDLAVKASPELWKRFDHVRDNHADGYSVTAAAKPGAEPPQDMRLDVKAKGRILWHYSVGNRSVYQDDMKYYGVDPVATKFADPFLFNTFGNLLEGPDLSLQDGVLTGTGKYFDIRVHALTMRTQNAVAWMAAIGKQAAEPIGADTCWEPHVAWWTSFWDRGWIIASDRTVPTKSREKLDGEATAKGTRDEKDGAALVSQGYNMFRFLMACQSRGKVPTKFNGGLFTQPLRVPKSDKHDRTSPQTLADGSQLTHEDDRLWGRRFTFQNQRLLYWPLLASGDFDLMKPFFNYYSDLLPTRTAITQAWFGHAGAYFRENIEPTGAERDCGKDGRPPKTKPGEKYEGGYHDYYFTSGLETTAMMLDYVNFTGDAQFRDNVLVPFARQILLFFDQHYPREADAKLRIDPGQVIETWWTAVNPAPDIAGLRFCLDSLLQMKAGTEDDQSNWREFRKVIPDVPMQTIKGIQAIAPAETFSSKKNSENGELYPVFPFRCFGVGQASTDVVAATMENRTSKDAFGGACWTQDQIDWAYAGRATEARDGLVRRYRIASDMCRFPLYGREGPDSCPDFDHFGAGSVALQRMLVQETDGKILLLPAWPADWDADFKLHLEHDTVICGTVKDGKLANWTITPESRKKDVALSQPQSAKAASAKPSTKPPAKPQSSKSRK